MEPITKKIIIIFLTVFIILQGIFFVLYFSLNKPEVTTPVVVNTPDKPAIVTEPINTDDQIAIEDNQNGNSLSDEKLTIVTQGQLQLAQRNLSSLESTLASRIPVNDKLVRFVSGNASQEVDISQFEKAMVDNTTYDFNFLAKKGKFLDTTNTSYLLQLQIPAQGRITSTFKWFLFDTNLQLVYKLNLKVKGLDLPGKLVEIKDYDNDNKDEILLETTKYLNPDNYSSPRYLFKALNEKQLVLVWSEETLNNDRDTGKCSSVTKIAFDQGNPPPPNNPELLGIKKIYTSALSPGLPKEYGNSTNYNNSSPNNIPVISNQVTYEEIREYPDRQENYQKVLDIYIYTWDASKMEFVYTKKESRNLDVNLN